MYICSYTCAPDSWAAQGHISSNTTATHDYIISLYWAAATSASVGYGDVTAHNTMERITSVMAMIVGVVMYGYLLGAIAATIANALLPK